MRDAVDLTCGVGCQKQARLAQSVERLALNQVVVGSSPTVGASFCSLTFPNKILRTRAIRFLIKFKEASDFWHLSQSGWKGA